MIRRNDVREQLDEKVIILIGRTGTDKFNFVKSVANFCVDHLKLRNSRFKFAVLPLRNEKVSGVAIDEDDLIAIFVKDSKNPQEMARTICHEFIHAAQMCRGLLKTVHPNKLRWRGKIYDLRKVKYLDRPWEILAIRGQDLLTRRYEDWYCTSPGRHGIISK